MRIIQSVLVVGAGGAGIQAASQFPTMSDFSVNRLVIDYPEALYKLPPREVVTLLPLGALKSSRRPNAPKSRERAKRDFNAIREELKKELRAADAVVIFTGLGGVVGSVCALGVAEMSHYLECTVVANVFMPFPSERPSIHEMASDTLKALAPLCVFTSTTSHAALNTVLEGDAEFARLLNGVIALHVWHSMDVLRMVKWL